MTTPQTSRPGEKMPVLTKRELIRQGQAIHSSASLGDFEKVKALAESLVRMLRGSRLKGEREH